MITIALISVKLIDNRLYFIYPNKHWFRSPKLPFKVSSCKWYFPFTGTKTIKFNQVLIDKKFSLLLPLSSKISEISNNNCYLLSLMSLVNKNLLINIISPSTLYLFKQTLQNTIKVVD